MCLGVESVLHGWKGRWAEIRGRVSMLCILGCLVVWRVLGYFLSDLGTSFLSGSACLGRWFECGYVFSIRGRC